MLIGETKAAADSSLHPLKIAGSYLGLIRDARFVAPARTASLLMAGVFAVFSGAPRVLLEGFGLSPITLGLLFAAIVLLVFGAGMLTPRLSARFGPSHATLAGLGLAAVGAVALLVAVLVVKNSLLPFLVTASIFLFGVGIASPLSSAAALSPIPGAGGSLVRLLANGGGRMRRVARGHSLQRSGHRARHRAGADVSSRAGPASVERAAGVIDRRFFTATAPMRGSASSTFSARSARNPMILRRGAGIAVTWLRKCFAADRGTSDAFRQ
jgi:hypothetical protein